MGISSSLHHKYDEMGWYADRNKLNENELERLKKENKELKEQIEQIKSILGLGEKNDT